MKKKLKIKDLTVSSFVTSTGEDNANTLKGGVATPLCIYIGGVPTDPVMACDPRDSVPTNCTCTGMYPSLRFACPTIDIQCV